MSNNILSIKGLHKSYQNKIALNTISLDIPKGSIYGLIGQNGAGKTTLIRVLNQIIKADGGTILFNNAKMTLQDVSQIGYLPEERGLYKNMTLEEQALYFGQLKGMSKKEAKAALDYWLHRFEISDWKKKKIEDLSKGMGQKMQFIITVLHRPKLLILDEPFSGFDPMNANLIAKEIKELAKNGTTVIFSSHRMESVAEMCDSLCLIHHGSILLKGSIDEIQKNHAQPFFEISITNYNTEELNAFTKNPNFETKIVAQTTHQVDLKVLHASEKKEALQAAIFNIGTLNLYKKHIPSLQEIFIKTIQDA